MSEKNYIWLSLETPMVDEEAEIETVPETIDIDLDDER